MLLALGGYGLAAVLDVYSRRVPNALWLVLLGAYILAGVGIRAVIAALGLAAVGIYGWRLGEIGGADAKGVALLPFALPGSWPVALAVSFGLLGLWLRQSGSDDVPLFLPIFVGVFAAVLVRFVHATGALL